MSIPKSPPPVLPLLTPQDKTKFMRLFQGSAPVNGLLSGTLRFLNHIPTESSFETGDKARNIFFKSKLPVDKLSQIWYASPLS